MSGLLRGFAPRFERGRSSRVGFGFDQQGRDRHVERDRGWFQEHGKLSSTASKAVLKAVNSLCADLRPDAAALVEAFGVPDNQLPLPANAQVALAQ